MHTKGNNAHEFVQFIFTKLKLMTVRISSRAIYGFVLSVLLCAHMLSFQNVILKLHSFMFIFSLWCSSLCCRCENEPQISILFNDRQKLMHTNQFKSKYAPAYTKTQFRRGGSSILEHLMEWYWYRERGVLF